MMIGRQIQLVADEEFLPILFVIDAQVDFVYQDGVMPCVNTEVVIKRIAHLIDLAHVNNTPVIFTREAHASDFSDSGFEKSLNIPSHCLINTPGFEIIPEVTPIEQDIVVDKKRYSAFLGTHLDILLNSFTRPKLFITGFTTNCCVHYTTMDAWQRDYPVHVLHDCVSATSEYKHEVGLKMLNFISTEIITNSNYFIDYLAKSMTNGRKPI